MKLCHYPDTDSLHIEFRAGPGVKTVELSDGLNVDLGADGNVVGFDIDHVSRQLDLSTLGSTALPLQATRIG